MAKETFDFRSKQKTFAHLCIIKRFDAEKVSCAKQLFLLFVPNDKGKHAAQLVEQVSTVFLIAVNEHFGIGLCCKMISGFHQFFADVLIVINFSVEYQNQVAIFAVQRLVSGFRYVDDA